MSDINKVYDALSAKYNVGTLEEFQKRIANDSDRRKAYDALSEDYDVGDYDSFSSRLGYGGTGSQSGTVTTGDGREYRRDVRADAREAARAAGSGQDGDSRMLHVSMREARRLQREAAGAFPGDSVAQAAYMAEHRGEHTRQAVADRQYEEERQRREMASELQPAADELRSGAREARRELRERQRRQQRVLLDATRAANRSGFENGSPEWLEVFNQYKDKNLPEGVDIDLRNERSLVRYADRQAREASRLVRDAMRVQSGQPIRNVVRGLFGQASSASTYTGGLSDLADAAVMARLPGIVDKVESGEELSYPEQAALDAAYINQMAEQTLSSMMPHGYKAGQTTAAMAPFMAQMAVNPLSGMGKAAARAAARSTMQALGRTGQAVRAARAAANGARVGGDIVSSIFLSNTLQLGTTLKDYEERLHGQLQFDPENGSYQFAGGDENAVRAFLKAETAQGIENFTEMMGEYGLLKKLTSGVGKGVERLSDKGLDFLRLNRVNELVRKMGSTDFARGLDEFLKKTRWDGILDEWGEEQYGILLNSALVGDQKLSDLFDPEQQIDILLGVGLFGGVVSAMKTVDYPIAVHRAKGRLDELTEANSSAIEGWDVMQEAIDKADDATLNDYAYNAWLNIQKGKETGTPDAVAQGVFDYITGLQRYRGLCIGAQLGHRDEMRQRAAESVEEGYNLPLSGYRSVNQSVERTGKVLDALHEREENSENLKDVADGWLERESAGGDVGVDMERYRTGLDVAHWDALEAYYNARKVQEGIYAGLEDRTKTAVDRFERDMLPVMTREADGREMITTATYNGEPVYVVDQDVNTSVVVDASGERRTVASMALSDIYTTDARRVVDAYRYNAQTESEREADFAMRHNPQTRMPENGMVMHAGDNTYIVTDAGLENGVVTVAEAAFDKDGNLAVRSGAQPVELATSQALQIQDDYYDSLEEQEEGGGDADERQEDAGAETAREEEVPDMEAPAPGNAVEGGNVVEEPQPLSPEEQTERDIADAYEMSENGDDDYLADNLREAQRALRKVSGRKPKATEKAARLEELRAIKAKREAAQAVVDRWQRAIDAKTERERADADAGTPASYWTVSDEEVRASMSAKTDSDRTLEEIVTASLGRGGGISIEDFERQTGLKAADRKRMVGWYRSEANGGRTLADIAHNIWQNMTPEQQGLYDDTDVANTLIEILSSAQSPSDITRMAENAERKRLQDMRDAERAQADAYARGYNFDNLDDMEAYYAMLAGQRRQIYETPEQLQEKYSTLANEYEKEDGQRIGQGGEGVPGVDTGGGVSGQGGAGGSVLQGAQAVDEMGQAPLLQQGGQAGERGAAGIVGAGTGVPAQEGTGPASRDGAAGAELTVIFNNVLAAQKLWNTKLRKQARARLGDSFAYVDNAIAEAGTYAKNGRWDNEVFQRYSDAIKQVPELSRSLNAGSSKEEYSPVTAEESADTNLSSEVDENGIPFVKSSDGSTIFGNINSGLVIPSAPIKLSNGIITDPSTKDGYGLLHIEARHGDEIRKAGFRTVEEFVEYVGKNYDPNRILIGKESKTGNGTYLIQVRDGHNNTLYIELSSDGSYWNVNSGGVFSERYGKNYKSVQPASAQQDKESVPDNTLRADTNADNSTAPNGNVSDTFNGKDTQSSESASNQQEESAEDVELNGQLYNIADLERQFRDDIEMTLSDNGIDAEIVGVRLIGSRIDGSPRTDSDLDLLVEYKGDYTEDSLFNLLNGEEFNINGVRLDINPITRGKSGTIEQFVNRNAGYSKESEVSAAVQAAREQVNTEPTEAQKKAGNYRMGHVSIDGYDITLENPRGSVRRGRDESGREWQTEMRNDYGYIRGTEGVDGDHIDVFLSDIPEQGNVYVVDQVNPNTGEFDEHKVMYGFASEEEARAAYLSNYSEGWQGLGGITPVSKDEFRKWIQSSHRKTKPFAEYAGVRRLVENTDAPVTRRIAYWRERLGAPVVGVGSSADITEEAARTQIQAAERQGKGWYAFYEPVSGKVYLNLALVSNPRLVDAKVMHEVVAHKGVREMLGEERYNALLDELFPLIPQEDLQGLVATYRGVRGYDVDTERGRRAIADEYIAHIAERMDTSERALAMGEESDAARQRQTLWRRFVELLRKAFGLDDVSEDADGKPLSLQEIGTLLRQSLRRYEQMQRESADEGKPSQEEPLKDIDRPADADVERWLEEDNERSVKLTDGRVETLREYLERVDDAVNPSAVAQRAYIYDKYGENVPAGVEDGYPDIITKDNAASTARSLVKDQFNVDDCPAILGGILRAKDEAVVPFLDELEKIRKENNETQSSGTGESNYAPVIQRARDWESRTGVKVKMLFDESGLTNQTIRKAVLREQAAGWFNTKTGEVCLYLPNLAATRDPMREVDTTFLHEVVSHKGLRLLLGNGKYDKLCDTVWDMMDKAQRDKWLDYVSYINGDEKTLQRAAADEYIASIAENMTPENQNIWQKFVAEVKRVLAELGLMSDISEEDLSTLLLASYNNLVKQGRAEREAQSKRAETDKKVRGKYSDMANIGKEMSVSDASEAVAPEQTTPKEKISDVGEKIGGAKKDLVREVADKINVNGETFAKIFPKFDFKRLIDRGLDPKIAAGLKFVTDHARKEFKSQKKRNGETRALNAARFIANYAKGFLLGDTSVDYTGNGWEFTDYGKLYYSFNIKLFGKLYDAMGEPLFEIDMSDSDVDIVMNSGELAAARARGQNVSSYQYYRDGKPFPARYVVRVGGSSREVFSEDEKDKAVDAFIKRVAKSVDYDKSHPYKLGVYYKPGVRNSYYIGVKIGNNVVALTPEGSEFTHKYIEEHNEELQALAARKAEEQKDRSKAARKIAGIEVVRYRESVNGELVNVYRIETKTGDRYVPVTSVEFAPEKPGDYSSLSRANKYLEEHRDELQQAAQRILDNYLQEQEERKGWKPEMNIGKLRPRVGLEHRNGKDVSADTLMDTFGFRGIEFGNYVSQKERQRYINEVFDALMDMAGILGLSPRAMSINGKLALAIGARGGSGAKAHYEPGKNVINLTKNNGWGALAHEWWHAVDFYFGDKTKPSTAASYDTKTRGEVRKAIEGLMSAIDGTDYANRSKNLDDYLNKRYYSTETELAARAFQDYITQKLMERSQVNDFLSHFTGAAEWNGKGECYPYPLAGEADAIHEAFENVFSTIQERTDEDGGVVLFSKDRQRQQDIDAVDEEMRSIKDAAVADGTFMKAPNGQPTKLDERRWLLVRTEAFKKWFGDWELAAKVTQVVPASINHGFTSLKDATQWAKENILRTYSNNETGGKGEITINTQTINKFVSNDAVSKSESRDIHYAVLKQIPYLLRESIDVEQHPDYRKVDGVRKVENGINDGITIHRLFGAASIEGKTYRVKITLKENTGISTTKAYSYEATKIELLAGQSDEAVAASRNSNNSISLAKLLNGIDKSYNEDRKLIDFSKVVDENGEPLVVYHGTQNDGFTIFDHSKKRKDYDYGTTTFMFSDTKEIAENYAGENPDNVFSVFLNVVNPKRKDYKGSAWNGMKNHTGKFQIVPMYDETYSSREEAETALQKILDENYPNDKEKQEEQRHYMYVFETMDTLKEEENTNTFSRQITESDEYDGGIATNVVDYYDVPNDEELKKIVLAPHTDYFVKNPGQIKSADPVTYDDDGNVIPLSQRFQEGNDDIRFSKAIKSADPFYSNAAKALEGIRQDKATAEQWLAMMQKNGGLKAEEDKWLGLSDWLRLQMAQATLALRDKSVSKAEIEQYIADNAVKVEEVRYAEYPEGGVELDAVVLDEWRKAGGSNYDKAEQVQKALAERYGERFGDAVDIWYDGSIRIKNQRNYDELFNDGAKTTYSTRLNYTTEGLDNKREIALTVPTIEPYNEEDELHFGDAGEGRAVAWIRFGDTDAFLPEDSRVDDAQIQKREDAKKAVKRYEDSIYDKYGIPNDGSDDSFEKFVLSMTDEENNEWNRLCMIQEEAERRIIDYTRQRVLVIDEIQSKRHQEGRENGYFLKVTNPYVGEYKLDETKKWSTADIFNEDGTKIGTMFTEDGEYWAGTGDIMTLSETNEEAVLRRLPNIIAFQGVPGVPDAPFRKNWHELAMKRMLRLAAEEGYDKIAWTNGEMQADRYNIGNVFDAIRRVGNDFTLFGGSEGQVTISVDSDYKVTGSTLWGVSKGAPLSDVVGKELAARMVDMRENDTLELGGKRIGGEGMKGFYDQILPAFMNKYGKKWGVKVQDLSLPGLQNEEGWHSVDVTPEMRESVMEGQPMFRKRAGKSEENTYICKDNSVVSYEPLLQETKTEAVRDSGGEADDAVTGSDGVRRKGDSGRKSLVDLGLRSLEPGEFCSVERKYTENKYYSLTSRKNRISSYEDVAYIFKTLQDSAVEHAFAVLVKDGKPTVIHLSIGGFSEATMDLRVIIPAVNEINPDSIYMVHNHPSGNLRPSFADRNMLKKFRDAFGSKVEPGMIIDSFKGEFGMFDSGSGEYEEQMPDGTGKDRKVKVYSFDKQEYIKNNPTTRINGADNVASFVMTERLGVREKIGALILGSSAEVFGNVYLPYNSIEGNAEAIAKEVSDLTIRMGGVAALLYGNNLDVRNAGKVARQTEVYSVRLLDAVNINSEVKNFPYYEYTSAANEGLMESNPVYQRAVSDAERPELADAQVKELNGRFSLVGVRAAHNALDARLAEGEDMLASLETARAAEERGYAADRIKIVTGWEHGKDGLWRYEIPDIETSDIERGLRNDGDSVTRHLSDYPDFAKYYPKRDVAINVTLRRESETRGTYNDGENRIDIVVGDTGELRAALAHELQHFIQHREGFPTGATPGRYMMGFDGRRVRFINDMVWLATQGGVRMTDGDVLSGKTLSDKLDGRMPDGGTYRERYARELANAARDLGFRGVDEMTDWLESAQKAFTDYRRTAGEVEARAVARRVAMTPAERVSTLVEDVMAADVPEDMRIYAAHKAMDAYGALLDAEDAGTDGRFSLTPAEREDSYRRIEREIGLAAAEYERAMDRAGVRFSETMQDSMRGLLELQRAVEKETGRRIEDHENAYMYENRMSSANLEQIEHYKRQLYDPLLDEVERMVRDEGVSHDDLNIYLVARHGLERNDVFAKRDAQRDADKYNKANPDKPQKSWVDYYAKYRGHDYSGLTALTGEKELSDAEDAAQFIVDAFEMAHDVSGLWSLINAATRATIETQRAGGLITKDVADRMRGMFEYYIPLRGFDETTSTEVYSYLNAASSPYNSPIKTAHGRRSLADDPIATIANMAESGIVQANRNLLKQRFLNMARSHRTGLLSVTEMMYEYDDALDVWRPFLPAIPAGATPEEVQEAWRKCRADFTMRQLADPDRYKMSSDRRNEPFRVVRKDELSEHQVVVKDDGREYVVTINGNPRAAQAVNGLTNPENTGEFLKVIGKVNRFMSANFTTRNPAFIISNLCRDGFYSNSLVWVKEGAGYAVRYNRNWARLLAQLPGLLHRYSKGTLDMSDKLDSHFKDFIEQGGVTGYTNLHSVDDYKDVIAKRLKRVDMSDGARAARALLEGLGDGLENMNAWAEGVSRFAAYLTSREEGRGIDQSVKDAKEISVNFNKKGSGIVTAGKWVRGNRLHYLAALLSQFGRSLYVFWNAGVQGLTNFGKAAAQHPGRFLTMAAIYYGAGILIPALFSGGDDDDDYYDLPKWVRRNNLCLRVGGKWVTLPLPIELRAIYGLGELLYSWQSGREYYTPAQVTKEIAEQISQIMPIDMMEGEGGAMALVPSAFKPLIENARNVDWTGVPLYRDNDWNKDAPEWTKAYQSVNPALVELGRDLNSMSGGNEGRKGAIDLNPAKLEHLFEGYLGGVATFLNKTYKSVSMAWDDEMRELRNVPVASNFVRGTDERVRERAARSHYFDIKDEVDRVAYEELTFRKKAMDWKLPESEREEAASELRRIYGSGEWRFLQRWRIMDKRRAKAEEKGDDAGADAVRREMVEAYRKWSQEAGE